MKRIPFGAWLAVIAHTALIAWAAGSNWIDGAPWWSGWAFTAMVFAVCSAVTLTLATAPGALEPGSRGFLAGAFTVAAFGIAGGAMAQTPKEAVSAVLLGTLAAVYQAGMFEMAFSRRRSARAD